jgi:hypothetical protein
MHAQVALIGVVRFEEYILMKYNVTILIPRCAPSQHQYNPPTPLAGQG